MPLIPTIGRKSFKNRTIMATIYIVLSLLGATMVVPFLITITGSFSSEYDYSRFAPVPRYFFSKSDRYVKLLPLYFNGFRRWQHQMRANIPEIPDHWSTWSAAGRESGVISAFAAKTMDSGNATAAADYAEFMHDYPLEDTCIVPQTYNSICFLKDHYEKRVLASEGTHGLRGKALVKAALDMLSTEWGASFDSFYSISFNSETYRPLDFQSYFGDASDPRYATFDIFKEYADSFGFEPTLKRAWLKYAREQGLAGGDDDLFPVLRSSSPELRSVFLDFKKQFAPATFATPYAIRAVWYDYLTSEEVMLTCDGPYTAERFNKLLGTNYRSLQETPFPIPRDFPEELVSLFDRFLQSRYPLRLVSLKVTPEMTKRFQEFARKNVGRIQELNKLLSSNYSSWDEVELTPTPPLDSDRASVNRRNLWTLFAKTTSANERDYDSSEMRWQRFAMAKYGSLEAINKAYGTSFSRIEESFPPFFEAYKVQFSRFGTAMAFDTMFENYRMIFSFLFSTGNSVFVTFVLIMLSIFFTLTVNPLAAYALSRFNLRGRDKILVFMLATMAFPGMVSAIPAYLLMRDLGMLNTFAALVIPGAASGMAIFILKGFFDSLPMELFEAATIDGASEMQIFRIVAMPLVKPILAINCLNAFIGAYNGWEWALIICQNRDMWTLAVWMYQASQWWGSSPWIVSAGFVIISIPTMIVFISCQKIILRGIIIPSMK